MVSIDIISGFLGAGKTTFANILLSYYISKGERPVYIVNEFGNTGIDASIIQATGFEAIEMTNGCVCCTLKNNIATTIKEVIDRLSPTKIVFEPSGVFVFDNFFEILSAPELSQICKTGSVITIVDSVKYKQEKIRAGSFLYNQIKNSPVLILSKTEITQNDIAEIICDLKNINPGALVWSKGYSELTHEALDDLLTNAPETDIQNKKHMHHDNLQTVTITLDKPFTELSLSRFYKKIKNNVFGYIYRIKGYIDIADKTLLLNVVFNDVQTSEVQYSGEKTVTFIGKRVNKERIERLGFRE